MSEVLLFTVLTLCIVGVLAAVVLYFVAQKFKVYEDPRIDAVESMLPGANCGGCGYPGCRGLADALVGSDDLSSLYCTAGGAETMKRIAEYLKKNRQSRSFVATAVAKSVPGPIYTTEPPPARSRRPCTAEKRVVRTVASEGAIACRSALSGLCRSIREAGCPL